MTEFTCTLSMVAIIGVLFVGFVTNNIDKRTDETEKYIKSSIEIISTAITTDFAKNLKFEMKK